MSWSVQRLLVGAGVDVAVDHDRDQEPEVHLPEAAMPSVVLISNDPALGRLMVTAGFKF
jgi:hypothetical protein